MLYLLQQKTFAFMVSDYNNLIITSLWEIKNIHKCMGLKFCNILFQFLSSVYFKIVHFIIIILGYLSVLLQIRNNFFPSEFSIFLWNSGFVKFKWIICCHRDHKNMTIHTKRFNFRADYFVLDGQHIDKISIWEHLN